MYNLNMHNSKEMYLQYWYVFLFTDVGVRYCTQNAVNEILADCVISDVRSNVCKVCTLLGLYTAYSGNSVWTFQDPVFRNVGTELPLYAA